MFYQRSNGVFGVQLVSRDDVKFWLHQENVVVAVVDGVGWWCGGSRLIQSTGNSRLFIDG